jgi:hypothetical protein
VQHDRHSLYGPKNKPGEYRKLGKKLRRRAFCSVRAELQPLRPAPGRRSRRGVLSRIANVGTTGRKSGTSGQIAEKGG